MAGVSIVLHELGHKFVAMASGFNAVYHANYSGLALGIILRFFSLPLFFVPAYVSISGSGSVIGYFFTALAGPLTNLSIYGICTLLLTKFSGKEFVIENARFINSLRLINMWLGIFNLLPIPGTDGFNALVSLRSL
jgi:Zn-dependent protease